MDGINSNSSSAGVTRHPCTYCQRRKVKCDRLSPCTGCLTHGQECRQPEAQRAPRRARRVHNESVTQRVISLEKSLEHMKALAQSSEVKPLVSTPPQDDAESLSESSTGRLIVEEEKSRYLPGSSWANLADEVRDLKLLLNEDELDREDDPGNDQLLSASLFGSLWSKVRPSPAYSEHLGFLWDIYTRNVEPIVKLFHIPSMQKVVKNAISNSGSNAIEIDCLLAAIKFAVVTSLRDDQCFPFLGTSRHSLLTVFRHEVESMLNYSNFLTSHDITTLQAYVLFLVCNRRHVQTRNMWVSTGVALRLAQSLGLHRDGTVMKLPVLATEIRRRLWWQIRMLDLASAEDCGLLPTHVYGEDTRLPLNIDDDDLSFENMLVPPTERDGFTEMTPSLIRYDICSNVHRFQIKNGKASMGIFTGDKEQVEAQSQSLEECRQLIETRYLRHCSTSIGIQKVAFETAQLMLSKLFLIVHYPLFHTNRSLTKIPDDLEKSLFETSCRIISSSHATIENPKTSGWSWLIQTYVHWHPVAYLLTYICRTTGADMQLRAWNAVSDAMKDPHGLEPAQNQAIWIPLQSLYEKAKEAMQRLSSPDARLGDPSSLPGRDIASILSTPSEPRGAPQNMEYIEPFLDLRPFTTIDDFMLDPTDFPNNGITNWWDIDLVPNNAGEEFGFPGS